MASEIRSLYHFRRTKDGLDARYVERLVELSEGRPTILAVQFDIDPDPDFTNCDPAKLPYDI